MKYLQSHAVMETGTADPMELIACPFDPVHMVQRKRMQYHIMKCQKVLYYHVTVRV